MKIIKDVDQRSSRWHELRLAVITGTKLKDIMSGATAYKTRMYKLIAEEVSGQEEQVFETEAMRKGVIREDQAKSEYEIATMQELEEVSFIKRNEWHGLSPDGIIANEEGKYTKAIEIKSPQPTNFVRWCLEGVIPKDYKWQVVNYFLVMEDLEELDFIIYNPDVNVDNLKIITITREELKEDIEKAEKKLESFRKEWQENILKLTK